MSSSRRHQPSASFIYPSTFAGSKGNAEKLSSSIGSYQLHRLVNDQVFEVYRPRYLLPQIVPKKTPPPLPPSVIEFVRGRSRSTGEDATPAATRGPGPMALEDAFINLHVHRANGDFIVEEMVALDSWLECFLNELDFSGLVPAPPLEPIDPSEEMDDPGNGEHVLFVEWSGATWQMEPDTYVDELVWDNMVLYWNDTFGYYVDNYGMSTSVPNYVTLVRTSARTLYAASKERI